MTIRRADTLVFFIPGEFTALNEYIVIERTPRIGSALAAQVKRRETARVKAVAYNLPKVTKYPVRIKMTWHCSNRKHDPDNIAFAKKFVLDGLVQAGVLSQDGWNQISGFSDDFALDAENPGVKVEIIAAA